VSQEVPIYRLQGAGPLLVYVAGLDGTGALFFKQAASLARDFRVATFRLRDGADFTYEHLVSDVASIIRDAGEERAVVLGESFGGTIALQFALRHPELIERLIIVNSFPRFRGRIRIRLASLLARHLPFNLTWLARVVFSKVGLSIDRVNAADRRFFFDAMRTVQKAGYARRLELISTLDLESRLSEINAPTLFVAGERDLLVSSVREARQMASHVQNATVKTVPFAGHACLLNERFDLREVLREWIGRENS